MPKPFTITLPSGEVCEFPDAMSMASFLKAMHSAQPSAKRAKVEAVKGLARTERAASPKSARLARRSGDSAEATLRVLEYISQRGHVRVENMVSDLNLKSGRSLSGLSSQLAKLLGDTDIPVEDVRKIKKNRMGGPEWIAGPRIKDAIFRLKGMAS